MNQNIMQYEKRRQMIEKKRRKRRKRIIKRNLFLLGCVIISFFLIKGIVSGIGNKRKVDDIEVMNQKNDKDKEKPDEQSMYQLALTRDELVQGNLILVNEGHPIRNYSDEHLVTIGPYLKGICQVKNTEIKLQKEAAMALSMMLTDFNQEVGKTDLNVMSGYRDFNAQEALHYESIRGEQSEDTVFVAKPDRSEHHTGLAVDFGLCYSDGSSGEYDGTGVYSWLNENCYKYGFIVRYDEAKKEKTGISHEPWHFRYVGKVHAQIMKELNLCLEEYIELIKGYNYYTHPGQGITSSTQNYSIYYVACEGALTNIPVPTRKEYSVSGNNDEGFIITVNLSKEIDGKQNLN